MAILPPQDALFLIMENRQQPTHVAGLQLFEPPEDAGPEWLREQYEQALDTPVTDRRFTRRARRSPRLLGQWEWVDDDQFDIEYHVRHSAVHRPGRIRELLALTSRLHGNLLDRRRPLWEAHVIEGLEDGRIATYTKVHHSMVDGVAAMRLLSDSLSEDPDARDVRLPWSVERDEPAKKPGPAISPFRLLELGMEVFTDIYGVSAATVTSLLRSFVEEAATLPFQAPNSILNVPITGARRFAAQSWEIERLINVKDATGMTVNDVVLAMSAGALRQHLLDLDALPDRPLIAMVPVSLRSAEEAGEGGNAVGLILCNLGTHEPDPQRRLELIRASMHEGKERMRGLNQRQSVILSAIASAPMVLGPLFKVDGIIKPPFNLVISNVPGPRKPLYWNGARLDGTYPLSIPLDGQAMNITVTSYVDHMEFGLTGCRRTVPHLQRMLTGLEDSLAELEKVAGV